MLWNDYFHVYYYVIIIVVAVVVVDEDEDVEIDAEQTLNKFILCVKKMFFANQPDQQHQNAVLIIIIPKTLTLLFFFQCRSRALNDNFLSISYNNNKIRT